jgi:hypothetical protein
MNYIIGYFTKMADARSVRDKLHENVSTEMPIFLLPSSSAGSMDRILVDRPARWALRGLLIGLIVGAILGFALGAGFGSLGAATAGWVYPLAGTLIGLVIGGFLGALYGTRSETSHAAFFKEALAAGGVLLFVEHDEMHSALVEDVLENAGGQMVGVYPIRPDEIMSVGKIQDRKIQHAT